MLSTFVLHAMAIDTTCDSEDGTQCADLAHAHESESEDVQMLQAGVHSHSQLDEKQELNLTAAAAIGGSLSCCCFDCGGGGCKANMVNGCTACTPQGCGNSGISTSGSCTWGTIEEADYPPDTSTCTAPCNPQYQQCGGSGWTGSTCCNHGNECKVQNEHYSQCLPQ